MFFWNKIKQLKRIIKKQSEIISHSNSEIERLRLKIWKYRDGIDIHPSCRIIIVSRRVDSSWLYSKLGDIFDDELMMDLPFPIQAIDKWHYRVINKWTIEIGGCLYENGSELVEREFIENMNSYKKEK